MIELTDDQLDDIWDAIPDSIDYRSFEEAERDFRLKFARAVLRVAYPEAQWITRLRVEVTLSKMTHNFTFTRDEVIELLGGKFNLLKDSK
jgi:hypothetical protein